MRQLLIYLILILLATSVSAKKDVDLYTLPLNIVVSLEDAEDSFTIIGEGEEIEYRDIMPGTHIKYEKSGNRYKETITLDYKPNKNKLKFKIDIKDYDVKEVNGYIHLYKDGEIVGYFERPYIESEGKRYYLPYEFKNKKYTLFLPDVLMDSISYPAVIDPTFVFLAQGLVGYYKLAVDATDSGIYSNDGVDTDVTYNGINARFNGSSSYINISSGIGAIGLGNARCFTGWVNFVALKSSADGNSIVFDGVNQEDSTNRAGQCSLGRIGAGDEGKLTCQYRTGGTNRAITTNDQLTLNKEHFFAYCIESGSQRIFLNNRLVTSDTQATTPVDTTPTFAIGGGSGSATSTLLNGTLREFRIYNRSLSATEIQQLYISKTELTARISAESTFLPPMAEDDLLGYCNISLSNETTPDTNQNVSYEYKWYRNSSLFSSFLLGGDFWAPFDSNYVDPSGAIIEIANNINGTWTNTVLTTGKKNEGLLFSNNNSYIDFGIVPLKNDVSLSIGAWINLSSNGTTQTIIAKDDNSGNRGFALNVLSNRSVQCMICRAGDNDCGFFAVSNETLELNTPTDIWCTFQWRPTPTNGVYRIYFDGELKGQTSVQFFQTNVNASEQLQIGRRQAGADFQYFNGTIDEVMIFERLLSQEDIIDINNSIFLDSRVSFNSGQEANVNNLSSDNTSLTESWLFSCRAYVNQSYSEWINSSSVTINDFLIDNCSTYTTYALNISILDENNITASVDYESNIEYWSNSEDNSKSFSYFVDNITKTQICINYDFLNLTSNFQIRYTDSEETIYDYFTFHTPLNNDTSELFLYTQNGTSQVLFTVQTINTDPVEEAYIHILKYDVGTNTFTTTEILKTDSQGQAIGNIILTTTFYNFLVYYQGELVYTEQSVKVIATTRTFTVDLEGVGWFNDFETTLGVNTNLYFNNITNNFVYTWTDPSGLIHQACLRVDKRNDSGKFNLSNNCVTSTSGTIIYNVATLHNGTEYIGTGYLKYDNEMITDIVSHLVESVRSFFRTNPVHSLFIAFLFCLALLMMGIPNPALSIALFGIGIIFSSIFGLYVISSLQLGSIIVLILIQLYLAGRQTK